MVLFDGVDEPQNADIHQNNDNNDHPIVQENLPEVQLNNENVIIDQNEQLNLPLESI